MTLNLKHLLKHCMCIRMCGFCLAEHKALTACLRGMCEGMCGYSLITVVIKTLSYCLSVFLDVFLSFLNHSTNCECTTALFDRHAVDSFGMNPPHAFRLACTYPPPPHIPLPGCTDPPHVQNAHTPPPGSHIPLAKKGLMLQIQSNAIKTNRINQAPDDSY